MDLLKRTLAPVLPEAWKLIDEEAAQVLRVRLAGRKLVDVAGPHGWKHAAVNLGRLRLLDKQPHDGVHAGLRQVQPLLELRTPIHLDVMELDSVGRGLDAPDLGAVGEAAERMARVEDEAIFHGNADAGIGGMLDASPHEAVEIPKEADAWPHAVVAASEVLRREGVGGPYALALGPRAYQDLAQASDDGYPIRRRVDQLVEGPLVWAPVLEGAVLLSQRGGDFELVLGQDLSIGYADHDRDRVELYLTESFTFRVLDPAAAIPLRYA